MDNKKQVLIVDDERETLDVFADQLKQLGNIEADTIESGKEGYEAIKSGKYKVVLLDLMMPDMDGFEILTKLKEENINVKVIVFSNVPNEEDKTRATELGAIDFLTKVAIEPEDLIAKINSALAN